MYRTSLALFEVAHISREAATGDSLGRQPQVFATKQDPKPRRGGTNVNSHFRVAPSGLGLIYVRFPWGLRPQASLDYSRVVRIAS